MWVAYWRSFCEPWYWSSLHKAPPHVTLCIDLSPAISPKLKNTMNLLAGGCDTLEEDISVQYHSSLLGLTAGWRHCSHWDLSNEMWHFLHQSEFWEREIQSTVDAANSNLCGNWKCPHKPLYWNTVSLKWNRRRTDWLSTLSSGPMCVLQCQSGWLHFRITVIIRVKIHDGWLFSAQLYNILH